MKRKNWIYGILASLWCLNARANEQVSFNNIRVKAPQGMLAGNRVAEDTVSLINWGLIALFLILIVVFFKNAAQRADEGKGKEAMYSLGAVGILGVMVGVLAYLGLGAA